MKQKKMLVSFIAGTILFSCSQANNNTNQSTTPVADTIQKAAIKNETDDKLKTSWAEFVNAVKSSDLKKIKDLSTDYVRCTDCVTNTDKEELELEKLRDKNPDNWDETLSQKLSLIPIDKFIKEDYSIVFSSEVKTKLADAKNIKFIDNEHNRKLYTSCQIADGVEMANPKLKEVIVNILPAKASPSSDEDLGWSAAFAFIETKDGSYKFCGYSTIP